MNEIDLKELWKLKTEGQMQKHDVDAKAILTRKSAAPLQKLKRNLYFYIAYSAASMLLFPILMWFFPYTLVIFGSAIIMAISMFFLGQLSVLSRDLNRKLIVQPANLLDSLRQTHSLIRSTFRAQEVIAIPFYAVSFLLGSYIGLIGNSDPGDFSLQTQTMIIIGILVVVVTFLLHKLEKWMNQKAFGVHLSYLKDIISQLEQEPDSSSQKPF